MMCKVASAVVSRLIDTVETFPVRKEENVPLTSGGFWSQNSPRHMGKGGVK